jgi:hypothetical protein
MLRTDIPPRWLFADQGQVYESAPERTLAYTGVRQSPCPLRLELKFSAFDDISEMHFPNLVMSTETSEQVT